jgi:uncharacterized delta-60 repeat protein
MRTRHAVRPSLESLEGKVLLSSGIADPARAVQAQAAKAFAFNGTLDLGFMGRYNPMLNEYFNVGVSPGLYEKVPFRPMGAKVHVSGELAHPKLLPPNVPPDLSDSTFTLSNAKGSLQVTFSPSTTNVYPFTISGGTHHFVAASGTTGTAVFTAHKTSFALTFRSSRSVQPAARLKPPSASAGAIPAAAPSTGSTIGPPGTVTTAIGKYAQVYATVIEPINGVSEIVAVGWANGHTALARYNPDGTLDGTFGSGGIATATISTHGDKAMAAVIQPDGKIVVAGYAMLKTKGFTSYQDFMIARFNTNGSLDTSFNGKGYVIAPFTSKDGYADTASGVALQTINGVTRIVVAGWTKSTSSSPYEFGLARYNLNGTLDTSFGSGGKVITLFPGVTWMKGEAMAVQPDGKIVVAGESNSPTSDPIVLARYNANGTLDTSFGNGGEATAGSGGSGGTERMGVALQSDGKIVTAGFDAGTTGDMEVTRFNADGTLDTSFGTNGQVDVESGFGYAVVVQPSDGKIVIGGESGGFVTARLNTDGSLDTTYGTNGVNNTSFGSDSYALVLQPDGNIVQGGTTLDPTSGYYVFALARYTTSGQLDSTF